MSAEPPNGETPILHRSWENAGALRGSSGFAGQPPNPRSSPDERDFCFQPAAIRSSELPPGLREHARAGPARAGLRAPFTPAARLGSEHEQNHEPLRTNPPVAAAADRAVTLSRR